MTNEHRHANRAAAFRQRLRSRALLVSASISHLQLQVWAASLKADCDYRVVYLRMLSFPHWTPCRDTGQQMSYLQVYIMIYRCVCSFMITHRYYFLRRHNQPSPVHILLISSSSVVPSPHFMARSPAMQIRILQNCKLQMRHR